jgi:hypothetical protein
VGIGTRYGLDGPRIESQWVGARITISVKTGPGAHPTYCKMVSFPVSKWLRRAVEHPPPSSAEVKERVTFYPYSTSGPSWPVLG